MGVLVTGKTLMAIADSPHEHLWERMEHKSEYSKKIEGKLHEKKWNSVEMLRHGQVGTSRTTEFSLSSWVSIFKCWSSLYEYANLWNKHGLALSFLFSIIALCFWMCGYNLTPYAKFSPMTRFEEHWCLWDNRNFLFTIPDRLTFLETYLFKEHVVPLTCFRIWV